MGSSEFLQALLSTRDKKYQQSFSFKTRLLLNFCKTFFPKYVEIAALSRMKLKNQILSFVKKYRPDIIIELGAGHSKEYAQMLENKKINRLIQVDLENFDNSYNKRYKFIEGDITKEKVWDQLKKAKSRRGLIIAEGLFTYFNNKNFDFVINNIENLIRNNFVLITHEPLKKISFSRRIISLFIGRTYRRFNSVQRVNTYYETKGLKIKVINASPWQVIYLVYR